MILVLIALLFQTITLGEPVEYPTDFYHLYELVETGAHGWVFEPCDISGSRLHWRSAVNLFEETEPEFENRAFGMLMLLFFAPKEYTYDICGDAEGKPILFGQGVSEFLAWYGSPEKYEAERWPVIAEGIAENLARLMEIFR